MMKKNMQGFTLLELAIVMIIIGVLLSYSLMPLRSQMETANIKQARMQISEIEEAIYGFAIATGRLPCPTFPGEGGAETGVTSAYCKGDATASNYIGFVPAKTLGITGEVNCDGLLMDPWGKPYYYSVTSVETGGTHAVFAAENALGIKNAGGPAFASALADIKVCDDLSAACTGAAAVSSLVNNAAAIIFSAGTRARANTTRENENSGEATIASTCSLPAYGVSNDQFYFSSTRLEKPGEEFDDIVSWISPNLLYTKLLKSGYILQ